jgi:hypothetical protein
MTTCDEALTALMIDRGVDREVEAHVATCPRCAGEAAHVREAAAALAADRVPEPAPGLSARLLRAADPLLARNARRESWTTLGRALGAALVPLPALLFLDVLLLRWGYGLLAAVLPAPLGLYLVFSYGMTLTVLLALTYGAIPIVAERQMRLRLREAHG